MNHRPPAHTVIIVALVCTTFFSLTSSTSPTQTTSAGTAVVAAARSNGATVEIIKKVLQLSNNGGYDATTVAAVMTWQRSHGLPATGVVDSPTWSQLRAAWLVMPAVGNDISWPQCPKGLGIATRRSFGLAMPPASAQILTIGVTNGPAFYPNPCLSSQAAWARSHHVSTATYAITTYPTTSQLATYGLSGPYPGTSLEGRLANTGYAQAQFNIASMGAAGLVSQFMWVDIEPYPVAPWSKSAGANKAVVDGALNGYRSGGLKVGFYSTKKQWARVLGSATYGLAEWRTAGPRGPSAALELCVSAESFQGGPAVLVQWWTGSADHDTTCPSADTPALVSTYFSTS